MEFTLIQVLKMKVLLLNIVSVLACLNCLVRACIVGSTATKLEGREPRNSKF